MLILGVSLSVPACLLAAFSPNEQVLIAARLLGGLSAGMAYPTTLALITALWSGAPRTKSIALWSAIGGGISALGPLIAGALLEHFWWGSVFLVTVPLAAVALAMAWFMVPAHVNEASDPVDNLGGILSAVAVGALVLAINFAAVPNKGTLAAGLATLALAAGIGFYIRQRRAQSPLYDLEVAARRIFWVAACAGIIVFGSLMAAMFIGQQFLQNVLGYSTVEAGAAILPAAVFMVLVAPRSAKLIEAKGSRFTLLTGYVFVLLGFVTMLVLLGRRHLLLGGRARLQPGGYRSRVRGHARVALSDRLGTREPRGHGLGYGRPPARPRRRDHAVDPRRDAHRGLRDRDGGGDRGRTELRTNQQHHAVSAPAVICRRGERRAPVPAIRESDQRGRKVVIPRRRELGVHRRHHRRHRSARRWCTSSSRSSTKKKRCSASTTMPTRWRDERGLDRPWGNNTIVKGLSRRRRGSGMLPTMRRVGRGPRGPY